jgi:hypothetical protein
MQTKMKIAAIGFLGTLALSGCAGNVQANEATTAASNMCTGGFEGWWNSTPADGNVEGLPLAGVTVHSETGRIVDAFHRVDDGSAESVPVEEVDYDVVVDPSWPKNNLVEIETATGKVLAMNEIPEQAPGCAPLS